MNTMSLLTGCVLAAVLSGCAATIALDKSADDPGRKIALQDKRSAKEKFYRRDGLREPIQYFGDEDFDSPPLMQLSLLIGSKLPPGNYDLEISKFRVIDIFPKRLDQGTKAAISGALYSMGYSSYFAGTSYITHDNITCIVSGHLQSKAVEASASVPYKISPMAGMVKNDPSFKSAANKCLILLSEKVAKSL